MTRLYTSIFCEKCGRSYAKDVGNYFGKKLGDKNKVQGICNICVYREKIEKEESLKTKK